MSITVSSSCKKKCANVCVIYSLTQKIYSNYCDFTQCRKQSLCNSIYFNKMIAKVAKCNSKILFKLVFLPRTVSVKEQISARNCGPDSVAFTFLFWKDHIAECETNILDQITSIEKNNWKPLANREFPNSSP